MNKKIFQTATVVLVWAIIAFGMSVFYYWLKHIGFIWDNPDRNDDAPSWNTRKVIWNTRKVILSILGLTSFVLTIVKVVLIWDKDAIKD